MKKQKKVKRFICFGLLLFLMSLLAYKITYSAERERITNLENRLFIENQTNTFHREDQGVTSSILICLGRIHFDPMKRLPTPESGLKASATYPTGQPGYYIVQFDGPIEGSWKSELEAAGAAIFDYIPDFAFIIKIDPKDEQVIRRLGHVRWLGRYESSYKISQKALEGQYIREREATLNRMTFISLRIDIFPGEDVYGIESEIQSCGGFIINKRSTHWKTSLEVEFPKDRLIDLSAISGIKWIETVPQWKLLNNASMDIVNVRVPRDTYGLCGEGQTVAVCDSGLDQGSTNANLLHDDFEDGLGRSRIIEMIDLSGDGAADVSSGHGTHVAGSVLGNGLMSGSNPGSNIFPPSCFAGMAPKANLVFQAIGTDSGLLSGIPLDLKDLFSQADRAGADLHTNSWGGTEGSVYSAYSEDVDQYMWDHPHFLILFPVGNNGADLDEDGIVDGHHIDYPATAKNCLSVGATEGDRPSGAGADDDWGFFWPLEFPVFPISEDHVSDDPAGMVAFGSRGPTIDGRYKPDIVAPGSNILSVRSSAASGTGWGVYDSHYMWLGGTSMATPIVAGAAALMREYLIQEVHISNPSAALIKAALLNSAEGISPGQYGSGIHQEVPDPPVPNNVEGWGRLNLGNGIFPKAPLAILYYDGQNPLNTGEEEDYPVYVTDAGDPFQIHLVWTDYPGTPASQGGLVNDLDLMVVNPSGTTHYPDNASRKSEIYTLIFDDGSAEISYTADKVAVRFTPPIYPVSVESATFFFDNPYESESDVDLVVYEDNGAGRLPGTLLYGKTMSYIPSGWITIGITGVSITSGDFYIALKKTDPDQGILQDDEDHGTSYYDEGSGWERDEGYTSYIRANVRGMDYSTSFDRVNNVVGLTLESPDPGLYRVKVSGYNIPHGPQSYALVMSGAVTEAESLQFRLAEYAVDENAGSVGITVTRAGSSGAVSVQYAVSNVSASDGTDYTAASGILNWSDGDASAKTFLITILDDPEMEGDETVDLTLSNTTGGISLGTPSMAILRIIDNETYATIQFESATYSADETNGMATITVTRTGYGSGAVAIDYATNDSTASAGSDYTSVSGTLSWGDGDQFPKVFTLPVINDGRVEKNETVRLMLSHPDGLALLGILDAAVLTITDDDQPIANNSEDSGSCFINTSKRPLIKGNILRRGI
ncbi:MAG: S8 family serine peptidase [Deltaproteobacteria bacterium]|nr:S8 family serine peptidase [Deltaproteobacteria bacterium]